MKRNEIRENILAFCEWAHTKLDFLQNQDLLTKKPKKITDEIMRHAAQYEDFYEKLDNIYVKGLNSTVEIDVGGKSFSHKTICKDILATGVAMLTVYGLSYKAYKQWAYRLQGDERFLILYGAIQKELPSDYIQKIKSCYKSSENYVVREKYAIELLAEDNGISIEEEPNSSKNNQYRVLNHYITYNKPFDKYNNSIRYLYNHFDKTIKQIENIVKNTYEESQSYEDNFYATITKIVLSQEEAFADTLLELTKYLREQHVNVESIISFRKYYAQVSRQYKQYCIDLFEPIIETYEQFYPRDKKHNHEYIDQALTVDSMRRLFMIYDDTDDGYMRTLAHVGNRAVDNILQSVTHRIADGITNKISKTNFASKMKAGLKKANFAQLCSETIFNEFKYELEGDFLEALQIDNFNIYNRKAPNIIQRVVCGYFREQWEYSISEDEVKNTLLNLLVSFPYHSEYSLGLIYMLYGEDGTEYDAILHRLHLKEEFTKYIDNTIEGCMSSYLSNLPSHNLQETMATIELIDDMKPRYKLLKSPEIYLEKYLTSYVSMLPADNLETTKKSINQIEALKMRYKKSVGVSDYLKIYQEYEEDYETIIKAKQEAYNIKQLVDTHISEANDKQLIELATNGNGYAQFMLLKMYQYAPDEFVWIKNDASPISVYLRVADYINHEGENWGNYDESHFLKQLNDCASGNIVCAATLIAKFLFYLDRIEEGKQYLRVAEKGGDPQAFLTHANYIRDNKYGFHENDSLAKQLEDIATTYGINTTYINNQNKKIRYLFDEALRQSLGESIVIKDSDLSNVLVLFNERKKPENPTELCQIVEKNGLRQILERREINIDHPDDLNCLWHTFIEYRKELLQTINEAKKKESKHPDKNIGHSQQRRKNETKLKNQEVLDLLFHSIEFDTKEPTSPQELYREIIEYDNEIGGLLEGLEKAGIDINDPDDMDFLWHEVQDWAKTTN